MIRLICIDVDGTLLGSSCEVDDATWHAADRARVAGIRLAICSGRPGFGVSRTYAERLDATGWHSFQNGASVVHLANGRSRSSVLAPASVEMLIQRARGSGYPLELYSDGDYVVEASTPRAREHAALLGVPFTPRSFDQIDGPIIRAQWLLSDEEAPIVLAAPHPGLELSPSTSPAMPETHFINITSSGIDKASAVRVLAAEYALPLDQVMFVGDGRNDAVAMRIVGAPIAMANSDPEALAASRYTVAHVDDGGLAQALEMALEL